MLHRRRSAEDYHKPEKHRRVSTSIQSALPTEPLISSPRNLAPKKPTFVSYLEISDLPQKIKTICEILATSPASAVEKALNEAEIRVSCEDVEEVLKHSYGFPGPSVKFFQWAGGQLSDNHSPYAWNLVVDLLGKNQLFDAMWDAVKSMKKELLVSLATFASIFSSYVVANRVRDALMTFEVMDQYGIPRDVVALNSLLSAICRDGKTAVAVDFFTSIRTRITPDGDTYAILLEGWEIEGNPSGARNVFDTMVSHVGWDPNNVPAYDSFLSTLMKGPSGIQEAIVFFQLMVSKQCFPGLRFLRTAIHVLEKTDNARDALSLWKEMLGKTRCLPDTQMCNSMIAMHCHVNEFDMALRFFDEMLIYGAFPDSQTYNVLLRFAMKRKRLREASVLFNELVKNEYLPSHSNCEMAIQYFLDCRESALAIRVWKCMLENDINPWEDSGNSLVDGLLDNEWLPEACKYAEGMIEKGVKLSSSTMSRLRSGLLKAGKEDKLDHLLQKLKSQGRK